MATRMRAISQRAYVGPEVLEVAQTGQPAPGPGETLVRVLAAGVNPADGKIRSGAGRQVRRPAAHPGAGPVRAIEALGGRVTRLRPGDDVWLLVSAPRRLR